MGEAIMAFIFEDEATEKTNARFVFEDETQAERPLKQIENQPDLAARIAAPFVSGIKNLGGAIVEPALQMATGFAAKPISEIGGMAAAGREMISPQGGDPEAFKRSIAEQLTYEPRTTGGKFVSQNILAPIGGVIEAGASAIGKGAEALTGSELAGGGVKEAAMQGVGFLGVKGAPKAAASIREANIAKAASLAEKQARETIANNIRTEGNRIGLIAPAEGRLKETLSNIGGANSYLSMKNMETITKKVGEDVGIKKGSISDVDVSTRIKELSSHYGAVESALGKAVPIKLDFKKGVNDLLEPMQIKYAQDPKSFASLKAPIELLEQQLKPIVDASGKMVKQEIQPSIVMDKIRQLRSDARKYDKDTTGDPAKAEMATTNYKLANLYEDLIENSLQKSGKTALLEKFRDARTQLSKIHVIEAARRTDGLIDPQKLASVIGKYADNKRVATGSLKIAADFANTFRKVTQPIIKSELPTASRWEIPMAWTGALGAVPTGGKSLVLASPMMARAIAPSLAERGLLQGKIPSYELSKLRQAAPESARIGMLGGAFSPYVKEEQQ